MSNDRVVLEEEQYVEALERIIERDFFPDLPALRRQNQHLRGDDATGLVRSTVAESVATTEPRDALARVRVSASVARSAVSSWDQLTPLRSGDVVDEDKNIHRTHDDSDPGSVQHAEDMTLNRFVATHTSEDNAAFTELQEKAIEDHKRRYHWAYDDDAKRGDAKLHLLTNGEWISKEQRLLVDQVLAPKGGNDNRPTALETWPHRARGALHFVPELEVSKEICKVETTSDTLLLKNGGRGDGSSSRVLMKSDGTDATVRSRGKRKTVYANSRFEAHVTANADAEAIGIHANKREMELVQMTPQIAPGVDASPLMTWGNIEGTPMILDARTTTDQILSGPRFVVKDTSTREKIADRLESQSRVRKAQSRQQTPTPLIARKRAGEHTTPSRSESIRTRLSNASSMQRTPLFGSNSELRASYATPLLPPRHSKSKPVKRR